MRKMPVRRQGVLFKMAWIVFLCCMAWTWQAAAEFGVSLHNEHGYSLHAFTFSYQEGYVFRPRVIVQYDPCFSGENRICAFDLYVNGEVCTRLEKWSNQAVPGYAEHRAEFRLDQYQSSEYVRELALVPYGPKAQTPPKSASCCSRNGPIRLAKFRRMCKAKKQTPRPSMMRRVPIISC